MSKIKGHTPGPWELVDAARPRIYHKEDVIATVEPDHVGKLACDRNARLIAAAPDLLAALKRIRDARDYFVREGVYPEKIHIQYHGCFDDWAADLADAAIERAAIARATGKGE